MSTTDRNNHIDKLQEDLLNELTEDVNLVARQTSELMVSLDEKQHVLYSMIVTFRCAGCRTL
jgi:hypothetical protein